MIVLLLVLMPLTMAAVPMVREQDPMIIAIDDIEGMLFEVPEYEDPRMLEHQLSSLGAMPIFTMLDKSKRLGATENKETPKPKLSDTQSTIDDIMDKLQLIRIKLERGNGNIYSDIQKTIQNLKSLEKIFRPDIRQVLSSLVKASISAPNPVALPSIELPKTTQRPTSDEKMSIEETPEMDREIEDHREISVKVISKGKPVMDKSALFKDKLSELKPIKQEKSIEVDTKSSAVEDDTEEHSSEELTDVTEENIPATEVPVQLNTYKMRSKNMDDIDSLSPYQSNNYVWK